jgi:hypothetical protein
VSFQTRFDDHDSSTISRDEKDYIVVVIIPGEREYHHPILTNQSNLLTIMIITIIKLVFKYSLYVWVNIVGEATEI